MSLLLPGKHVSASDSLLRQAEVLFTSLDDDVSVAQTWIKCRDIFQNISFARFVLMLDLLFAVQLLEYKDGQLLKRGHNAASP